MWQHEKRNKKDYEKKGNKKSSIPYFTIRTRNNLISVRMPILRVEKCPQIHIFSKPIKVYRITFFPDTLDIFKQNGLIENSNPYLWKFMGKQAQLGAPHSEIQVELD